jgi:hypothetical protein
VPRSAPPPRTWSIGGEAPRDHEHDAAPGELRRGRGRRAIRRCTSRTFASRVSAPPTSPQSARTLHLGRARCRLLFWPSVADAGGTVVCAGERKAPPINADLWHACAGPLVSLPPVGSLVVYFPQGHSEQVTAATLPPFVFATIPAASCNVVRSRTEAIATLSCFLRFFYEICDHIMEGLVYRSRQCSAKYELSWCFQMQVSFFSPCKLLVAICSGSV